MDYWTETMQDDCYIIATDGWNARTSRIIEKNKKGKEKDKGWTCDLIPKSLIVANYFAEEQAAIEKLTSELENISARKTELEEEHSGEDGAFSDLDRITKSNVKTRLKEVKGDTDAEDELVVLNEWLRFSDKETKLKKEIKDADADLDRKAYNRYPTLTEDEIKTLVVDDKWLDVLEARTRGEMDRISQTLTRRVKELAERYEMPMPEIECEVSELEAKVNSHLERMGFSWE
jgi:type I restriction enzyme M protein